MPWAQAARRESGTGVPRDSVPPYARDTSLTPPTWDIGGPVQRHPGPSASSTPPWHPTPGDAVARGASPAPYPPPRATVPAGSGGPALGLSIASVAVTPLGLFLHVALLIAMVQADQNDVGGYGGLTVLAVPIGGTIALMLAGTALAFAIRSRSRRSIILASTGMGIWLITVILAVTTVIIGLVRDVG